MTRISFVFLCFIALFLNSCVSQSSEKTNSAAHFSKADSQPAATPVTKTDSPAPAATPVVVKTPAAPKTQTAVPAAKPAGTTVTPPAPPTPAAPTTQAAPTENTNKTIAILVKNELGETQVWEKIELKLDGKKYLLSVNDSLRTTSKKINLKKKGLLPYQISAKTLLKDGKTTQCKSKGTIQVLEEGNNTFLFILAGELKSPAYSLKLAREGKEKIDGMIKN